jgi:RND superfamily putative drug exporter
MQQLVAKSKEDSVLRMLGTIIYRTRWIVILVSIFILAGMLCYDSSLSGSLKSGGFNDPTSESTRAKTLLDARLGGATPDVIVLMRSDALQVTDPIFVNAAQQVISTLQVRAEVASIRSFFSTHDPHFLSLDGHETFVVIELAAKDESRKERDFKTFEPLITSSTLHLTIGGQVAINVGISRQISADLEQAELITFPITALLLLLIFNGLVAASLPLLLGGVAILGALAFLRLLAGLTDVSIYAINVVTMLGLGLAIDYSLFIVTRFREELKLAGGAVHQALQRTMATAGTTILFSGLTVSTSLLSLLLFPQVFLRSIGMGAIVATLFTLLAALTLLPALLALLGNRINALSLPDFFPRSTTSQHENGPAELNGAWYRLSVMVMRRPSMVAIVVLTLLVGLGVPFLHASFSTPDVSVLPASQEARVVSDRLTQDFAQQGNAQLVIAVTAHDNVLTATTLSELENYVHSIKSIQGVVAVESLVTLSPSLSLADYQQIYAHLNAHPQFAASTARLANGNVTKITVFIEPADRTTAAEAIVQQVRAIKTPAGFVPLVYGITASQLDLFASLRATLPFALLLMAIVVLVLLFLMTGSLLIPLKAIVLNILSLTATFGGLVWVFQDGHLQNWLDFQSTGSLDALLPILIFCMAFGLSMDYEVFLLSRIKERFDELEDNGAAISSGLERTGWLITSAAILLAIVVGAFGGSKIILLKEIGIGLAIAVCIDATLVRLFLVPATMCLLGNWNWWAPQPLRAVWRFVGLGETATSRKTHGEVSLVPLPSTQQETTQI